MSEREGYCEACGAAVKEYKHGLSIGLARSLYKTAVHQRRHGSPVMLSEVNLEYGERCNFQKLRYWELVVKAGDPSGKGGQWYVTQDGFDFLRGDLARPQHVWTFHAKVIGFEGELITIDQITDGWKWRPDYAREAKPHG